jgi:hypothetical protein
MTDLTAQSAPVKDFTEKHTRLLFRIDDDVFEAAPALPGKVLAEFVTRYTANADGVLGEYNAVVGALSLVLFPSSSELFQERLGSLEKPIKLEQASDIILWLLEQYGARPTQPSSPSSDGPPSPVSGTSSTDAAPQTVSIPATFQPIAS